MGFSLSFLVGLGLVIDSLREPKKCLLVPMVLVGRSLSVNSTCTFGALSLSIEPSNDLI